MKIPIRFSKLSGVSAIGLTNKYRYNPYVRSTINIIVLQVLLALLVILIFGYVLRAQQEQTVATIIGNIEASVEAMRAGTRRPTDLDATLDEVHDDTLRYTLLGIVLITIFFGYLSARYALRPTRDSLRFQKQFIGNMAHEIRTPLAVIKTNTEVALMDPRLGKDAQETFSTTLAELDRISGIINNLLSFDTLIRPGRQQFEPVDLHEVAGAVISSHEELARSRGIDLSYHGDPRSFILGSRMGIDQVLTNLVKNALNYTPQHQGGVVSVSVREDGDSVAVSVSDTGIGIARKDLYHIFQPYYRADTSRVRDIGGGTSGLGLAIVNEIVKQHNGRIFVRSALNRGTTIEAAFPKAARQPGEEGGREDEDGETEFLILS